MVVARIGQWLVREPYHVSNNMFLVQGVCYALILHAATFRFAVRKKQVVIEKETTEVACENDTAE